LDLDASLQARIHEATLALGRLDSVGAMLPDARLFLYSYVRKEAVMSSQIEGAQTSLNDLLLYEMDSAPGVRLEDVQEGSCHVARPIANIAALTKAADITPATAGKVLDALEHRLGLVRELTGQRRNRVFAYTGYIDLLNQEP